MVNTAPSSHFLKIQNAYSAQIVKAARANFNIPFIIVPPSQSTSGGKQSSIILYDKLVIFWTESCKKRQGVSAYYKPIPPAFIYAAFMLGNRWLRMLLART